VGRAQAPVWHVEANYHLERKTPYVNHYSFHILDRDWGHITIKLSGHPFARARVGADRYSGFQAFSVGSHHFVGTLDADRPRRRKLPIE
ncbi:MAG TPA: hypothetical protein VJY34_23350, partial [Roseiarcus sp.]|nr:hypothetical protein [Roseiarcus sp.]